MKRIVGLFRSYDDAERSMAELSQLGIKDSDIGLLAATNGQPKPATMPNVLELPDVGKVAANSSMLRFLKAQGARSDSQGVMDILLRMGLSQSDARGYLDGIRRGGVFEAFDIPDEKEAEALSIMRRRTSDVPPEQRLDAQRHLEAEQRLKAEQRLETERRIEEERRQESEQRFKAEQRLEAEQRRETERRIEEERRQESERVQAERVEAERRLEAERLGTERLGAEGRSEGQPLAEERELVIPIVEEQLLVGKREKSSGVRVDKRVTSEPVEKTISIREEHIDVQRRKVDRILDGEPGIFEDRVFEMKAFAEEPVVTKRARVVEEVHIHKDRKERVETIRDNLRRTEVDITEVPSASFDASRHTEHFKRVYEPQRYSFETVAPAYHFGERLRRHSKHGDWSSAEREASSSWERQNPGTWERFKEAIRAGWESVRH